MLFASDTGSAVGKQYAAFDPKSNLDDRSLYVVAPDGTIAYHVRPFKQMVPDAYTELAGVVDRLSPPEDEEAEP
jgi:peroxiredoxin